MLSKIIVDIDYDFAVSDPSTYNGFVLKDGSNEFRFDDNSCRTNEDIDLLEKIDKDWNKMCAFVLEAYGIGKYDISFTETYHQFWTDLGFPTPRYRVGKKS